MFLWSMCYTDSMRLTDILVHTNFTCVCRKPLWIERKFGYNCNWKFQCGSGQERQTDNNHRRSLLDVSENLQMSAELHRNLPVLIFPLYMTNCTPTGNVPVVHVHRNECPRSVLHPNHCFCSQCYKIVSGLPCWIIFQRFLAIKLKVNSRFHNIFEKRFCQL